VTTEKAQGRQFTIELGEGGIVHLRFHPDARLGREDVEELMERAGELLDGKSVPVLANLENVASADQEARKLGASLELFTAAAIVSQSAVGRTIGNFYLAVSRPSTPSKLFASEEQARAWLEEQA
jgi:hypothetical protein